MQPAGNFTCPEPGSVARPSSKNCSQLLLDFHLERRSGRALHTPLQIIRTRNEWHLEPNNPTLLNRLSVSLSEQPGPRPPRASVLDPIGRTRLTPGGDWSLSQWASVGGSSVRCGARGTFGVHGLSFKCDLVVFLSL